MCDSAAAFSCYSMAMVGSIFFQKLLIALTTSCCLGIPDTCIPAFKEKEMHGLCNT